jgi:hypothetical protein
VCALSLAGELVCDTLRKPGPWEQVAAGLHFVCVSRAGPVTRCFDLAGEGEDITPARWQ